MHYPTVGERVWVRGCSHLFIVVRADYSTRVATIMPVEVRMPARRCAFSLLFAFDDFEASQAPTSAIEAKELLLETTEVCTRSATVDIRELKNAISLTRSAIARSQDLIAQTDQTLARWKFLGCRP